MPNGQRTAHDHLRAVAIGPRFAGSTTEREAARYCRAILEQHGFSVREEPFSFSSAIGRWMVPFAGVLCVVSLAGTALMWSALGPTRTSAIALLVLAALLAVGGATAARRWVLTWPSHRVSARNLVATRGQPAIWLVAHLDTKSQPIPSLVRAVALVVVVTALVGSGLVGVFLPGPTPSWALLPIVGAIAAGLVAVSIVGNESPGAADNASGVACVLATATALPPDVSLGVVLTSGEELGLAGARAWVASRDPGVAINIDTVDDQGRPRCMTHGRRSRRLARSIADTAASLGEAYAVTPLIPGILTDGVALADGGWEAVTLTRGTLATLGRIHRPRDSVQRIQGTGADALAVTLAHYLREHT
ncbi:MAG: M28 family peptidase [Gemmatimonadaceae bacterium]